MGVMLAFVLPTLAAVFLAPAAYSSGNLLDNPGFERGKKRPDGWSTSVPLSAATSKPRFSFNDVESVEGKRSATVRADFRGGFTAWAQVLKVPAKARSFHLEGMARLENVTYDGGARLMVTFVGPKVEGGSVSTQSSLLRGIADWTKLSLDAAIPDGTKSIEVRCGVIGPCMASFDGLVATASNEEPRHVSFHTLSCDYAVRLPANALESRRDGFVRLPLPLSGEGQMPIGIRVNTRPEEAVSQLSFYSQGQNRMLEVRLAPLFPNDTVKLRVESLVMIEEAAPWGERVIRLPRDNEMSEEMRELIGASPGIEPTAKILREAIAEARREVSGSDLLAAVDVVRFALEARLKMRGGESGEVDYGEDGEGGEGDAGAVDGGEMAESSTACLEAGEAGLMGYANVCAALLRGLRIPARLVQVTRMGDRVDRRYFVDLWVPAVGWTRMDPVSGEWPVERRDSVAYRVVDPLTLRSAMGEPFDPKLVSEGLVLEERSDRIGRTVALRPGEMRVMPESGVGGLVERVEASFRSVLREPMVGDVWLPVLGVQEIADRVRGARAAHEAVGEWLELPRLVGR